MGIMARSLLTNDASETTIPDQERQNRRGNWLPEVLASLVILALLLTLFTFRTLDDNRLVSWLWVFDDFSPVTFTLVILIGMIVAYALSHSPLANKTSLFFLFIASVFVQINFWSEPEVIIDAARYFNQAKYLELYGVGYFLKEWGNEIPAWTDLPLAPFIYGVIFRIFGEHRIGIQIFNTSLFFGTIVLTYLIGKILWSKNIGLNAGVLLLGMPYLIIQVPLMMVDIAAMFFLTLAVFATIKAVEGGKTSLCILSSAAIVLAILTKYSNWLMLSIIPMIVMAYYQLGWKVLFRRGLVIALGVLLPMVILLAVKFDLIVEQWQLLRNFQAPALNRWQESWISTFFFQIHPVITLSALFSIYLAAMKKDAKYLVISWLVLLIFLLELKRIRYVVVLLPMLALMASYGLSAFGNLKIRRFIVFSTAITASLLTVSAFLPFLEKNSSDNLMQAGKYLDSINVESTEVIVLPQTSSTINPSISLALLDLFTNKDIVYYDRIDIKSPSYISKLPWRWTWEVQFPRYRANHGSEESNEIVVVIQSIHDQQAPPTIGQRLENYHLLRKFTKSSRAFRYKSLVYIYQRT